MRIFRNILISILSILGTLILIAILSGSIYIYFYNDQFNNFLSTTHGSYLSIIQQAQKGVEQCNQIVNDLNANSGQLQQNITDLINNLKGLVATIQPDKQQSIQDAITQLEQINSNLIPNINNLLPVVNNVQATINNVILDINKINVDYVNPTVDWIIKNGKKTSLIVMISISSFLALTLLSTIIVFALRHKKKNKEKNSEPYYR